MSDIKGRYSKIEISLNTPETEKELFITGDYLSLLSITGAGSCEIKIDHRHAQTIDLREITEISGVFKRIYFTTDGAGGICTFFVGTGLSMHVSSDPQKLRNAGVASIHISTTVDTVKRLADSSYILNNISILNINRVYACYIGQYNSDVDIFKEYAYILLPQQTLKFGIADMHALATIAYNGVNNVVIDIIGTHE